VRSIENTCLPEPRSLRVIWEPMGLVDVKEVPHILLGSVAEGNHMRPLVEPPRWLHCTCGGELRFKRIEPADRILGKQREIFVCIDCSREETFLAEPNPYVTPTICGPR